MRKGIAIICFVAFISLQYGKLMSYWHCQLQASGNKHCDCEKILLPSHAEDTLPVMATLIQKEKVEENRPVENIIADHSFPLNSNDQRIQLRTSFLAEDHSHGIDRPPRV